MSENKRTRLSIIVLHVLACVAFMCIPIFSTPYGSTISESFQDGHYKDEIMEYALTILFFYINYFYLIPKFYLKGRYILFTIVALLGFIIAATLPEMISMGGHMQPPPHGPHGPGGHMPPPPPGGMGPFGPFGENFLKYSFVFILAITLRITTRLRQTEKAKVESELQFLKAQLDPHFLFNTLNSIYALAVAAKDKVTADAIVKLSGMMRYAFSEATGTFVSLSKDLAYIDNYILLQKLRLPETAALTYKVTGNSDGKNIAPFLMIPFIENAFKYGVNVDEDSDINIDINIDGNVLIMQVVNKKVFIDDAVEKGSSIGIANTRMRLDLLYSNKHQLSITDAEAVFHVYLSVTL